MIRNAERSLLRVLCTSDTFENLQITCVRGSHGVINISFISHPARKIIVTTIIHVTEGLYKPICEQFQCVEIEEITTHRREVVVASAFKHRRYIVVGSYQFSSVFTAAEL